jgi:hypothetical protein
MRFDYPILVKEEIVLKQDDENIPLAQRIMDNPFLLLGAGLFVMFVFYTGWGLLEVMWLPDSQLP